MAAVALGVYIGRPLLTGEYYDVTEPLAGAATRMTTHPVWYHGIVIVLPSLVVSLLGTLILNRWGLTGAVPALKFLGGILLVPSAAVFLAYLVTAVVIGVVWGTAGAAENPVYAVFGVFVFTGLSLALGFLFMMIALVIVVTGVVLGASVGYLVARGLIRVGEYLFDDTVRAGSS
ncbi:hypothetical protein [Haloarcula nitratireducens]|uniref:Uncharacterized protein n=1 Tax=Haloarcula nitratireducens TaxID=2487749 RepID=A0AAW4PHZ4_9EURY|nr:hypothetical protein [Halomicroarcula nitratireducens]MBX0297367.1 hypothetical protein [Halomicroarcula nitratireducens]